jgi:hypothetical protein
MMTSAAFVCGRIEIVRERLNQVNMDCVKAFIRSP